MKIRMLRIFSLLFVFLLIASACSERMQKLDFKLDRLVFEATNESAYTSATRTENAEYLFAYGTSNEKTRLVRQTEILLATAKEQYNITSKYLWKICFTQDTDAATVDLMRNDLILKSDELEMVGALFYAISGERLPAWLCAGLEIFWLERYGLESFAVDRDIDLNAYWFEETSKHNDLPNFGDEWLIQSFVGGKLSQKLYSVAYAFVNYLYETKQLSSVVSSYMNDDRTLSTLKAYADAWEAFSGQALTHQERATLHYTYESNRINTHQTSFVVYGKQGYYFYIDDIWSYDTVLQYTNSIENGIQYVKDWFSYTYERPIPIFLTVEAETDNSIVGGRAISYHNAFFNVNEKESYGGIALYHRDTYSIIDAVHEAVHVLTRNMNDFASNYPSGTPRSFLEEGLCNAVTYYYGPMDELAKYETLNKMIPLFYEKHFEELSEIYESKAGRKYTEEPFDYQIFADSLAIYVLRLWFADQENKEEYFASYKFMDAYETSASFIMFLLNHKGTKEDFRAVYKSMILIEKVYGQSLDSLIAEWFDYLEFEYKN